MVMALAVYHTSADDDWKGIVSGICGRCNLLVKTRNSKIARAVPTGAQKKEPEQRLLQLFSRRLKAGSKAVAQTAWEPPFENAHKNWINSRN
jgi:hypothetical protein